MISNVNTHSPKVHGAVHDVEKFAGKLDGKPAAANAPGKKPHPHLQNQGLLRPPVPRQPQPPVEPPVYRGRHAVIEVLVEDEQDLGYTPKEIDEHLGALAKPIAAISNVCNAASLGVLRALFGSPDAPAAKK